MDINELTACVRSLEVACGLICFLVLQLDSAVAETFADSLDLNLS